MHGHYLRQNWISLADKSQNMVKPQFLVQRILPVCEDCSPAVPKMSWILKMTISWEVLLCSFVGVDWCFTAAYCLHHHGEITWCSMILHTCCSLEPEISHLELFLQLAHSYQILTFCHKLNPHSAIFDKLWYTHDFVGGIHMGILQMNLWIHLL
jgi:hypothetical protein